jgi:Tol biopolymer transport system component
MPLTHDGNHARREPSGAQRRRRAATAALGLAALMVSCGGGDGGGNTSQNTPPSKLTGTFYGPIDSQVTLQVNAGDDLDVRVQPVGNDPYNAQNFSFANLLPGGSAYQVSLKATPAGQTCEVFKGASGTMPAATGALHAGCEITDDLVSRSTTNNVFGSYTDASAPAVGGANVPIGRGTLAFGEGRFVVFVSSAAGMASGTTTAHRQVYWRDRFTGETKLVSLNAAGAEGDGDSFAPAISADGLTVAFDSTATNLVANDTNGLSDVFVWDAQAPTAGVVRASVGAGSGGTEANGASVEPTLSGDGQFIAFSTNASNLTTGVAGNAASNIVLRDLVATSNRLVSADIDGIGRGGARPMLSEDGGRLVFWSLSGQLVGGDANGLWDIFVFDRASGLNTRISLTSSGAERNQGSDSASRVVSPAISGNGRFVSYATTASNVVGNDSNALQDVFVVDLLNGAVTRASTATGGVQGNADSPVGQGERAPLSYDGAWVAFSTLAGNLGGTSNNVAMHNLVTGETRVVSNQLGSSVGAPALSRDAGYVVFGAGQQLDSRFASTGLFAHYTNIARSFWWLD